MAHSIAKYSLFYLTLVLITQQYLSVPPQPGWERERAKRAVLQDAPDGNQTSGGRLNSSLTSAERLEQLQKLRDAETMLRKNLKEKGKEYENQLYENWPKNLFHTLDEVGPDAFLQSPHRHLFQKINMSEADFRTKFRRWVGVAKELPVAMAIHLLGYVATSDEKIAMLNAAGVNGSMLGVNGSIPSMADLENLWKGRTIPDVANFEVWNQMEQKNQSLSQITNTNLLDTQIKQKKVSISGISGLHPANFTVSENCSHTAMDKSPDETISSPQRQLF